VPARPHGRQTAKAGSTRQRILAIVGASTEPVSPAQIRHAMAEQGGFIPKGGSVYSMIQRLTEEGGLRKIADGQYTLPSRNGDAPTGATENGSGQPLSMVGPSQEAANE
jgi:Fe2+ or Zn2+ uptake regulation protein